MEKKQSLGLFLGVIAVAFFLCFAHNDPKKVQAYKKSRRNTYTQEYRPSEYVKPSYDISVGYSYTQPKTNHVSASYNWHSARRNCGFQVSYGYEKPYVYPSYYVIQEKHYFEPSTVTYKYYF